MLKDPPPEYEFIADPPSISAYDLDVVKLTAQFVARNGRQFLTNLMVRRNKSRCKPSITGHFDVLSEKYEVEGRDVLKLMFNASSLMYIEWESFIC